ncbi:hypothetical protein DPU24_25685 [Salmonella enterica subsp. enterica serovar Oranienburg]|nr:hypothetical protein [Salmonella enterica subsp. enterica serovar Oranienburg]HAK8205290.1 hypothetical protein [Salmonella enterica]
MPLDVFSRPNFWIPAMVKIFAIYAFFVEHMGYGYLIATILAVILCFVPIISEGLFIAGAIYGWHIEWYYAVIILVAMYGFRYKGIYW